jgi:hypothetical protein
MKELEAYGRRHRRVLTVALFGGVGAYLVGKGALRVL